MEPLGAPLVAAAERRRLLGAGAGAAGAPRRGEVLDAQGRRRLHGAFTGGFSAGYYNSVGSAEGWRAPAGVVSSRAAKARSGAAAGPLQRRRQRPEDFMDEDDDPLLGLELRADPVYDAGGDLVVAAASPVLRTTVTATSQDSFGAKMLRSLGWRPGDGLGPRVVPETSPQRVLANGSVELSMRAAVESHAPSDTPSASAAFREDFSGLGFAASSSSSSSSTAAAAAAHGAFGGPRAAKRARHRVNEGIGVGVFDEADIDDIEAYDEALGGGALPGRGAEAGVSRSRLAEMEAKLRSQQRRGQQRSSGDPLAGFAPAKAPPATPKIYPVPELLSDSASLPSASSRQGLGAKLVVPALASRFVKAGEGSLSARAGDRDLRDEERGGCGVRIVRTVETWQPSALLAKRLGVTPPRTQRERLKGPQGVADNGAAEDAAETEAAAETAAPLVMRAIFDGTLEGNDEPEAAAWTTAAAPQQGSGAAIKFRPRSERQGS